MSRGRGLLRRGVSEKTGVLEALGGWWVGATSII